VQARSARVSAERAIVLKSGCSGGVLRRSFCRRSSGVHNEVSSLRGTLRGLKLRLPSNRHSAQLCLSLVNTEHGHKTVEAASPHGVWLHQLAHGDEACARRLYLPLLVQLLRICNLSSGSCACRQQGRSRDGRGCAGQQRQGGGRAERRRRAPACEPCGALGVRKHGKAGKRGALSHKQKWRKAQALEKVSLRASIPNHLFRNKACCDSEAHVAGAGDRRPA